jgi:hypothetical protein
MIHRIFNAKRIFVSLKTINISRFKYESYSLFYATTVFQKLLVDHSHSQLLRIIDIQFYILYIYETHLENTNLFLAVKSVL